MKYIVTTSHKPSAELIARANKLAEEYGVPYISRRKLVEQLKEGKLDIDFYYVLDRNEQLCIIYDEHKFFFHPSMAKLRLKNYREGQRDHLIENLKLEGNEEILDTTFGLGSEALLMAYFLETGRIVGLEASLHVYRVVNHGLKHYPFQYQWMRDAVSKITLLNQDLRNFLRNCADEAFDIIYCDPMFEVPQYSSSSLNPLRPFAIYDPITLHDVREMIRVAKKRVVLKSRVTDTLFEELEKHIEFSNISGSKSSGVIYGVIEKL
ncbi:class I SAM-dependent methyltransferase [Kosmotoga pacifica]|uniref:Methyltransferase n=1 Tax=Kosmotoga pacifica TaxID=1330330 RepID=A0A0G2ZH33_9BACT|nr:class I SAM-dependent methyltransferase [Kosmotoga pacifica]AKI98073.1 methyltransferase [Kosmotoga pacifica]